MDADGRSLLADAVVRAPTTGIILPSERTGPNPDVAGRDTDTSVPSSSTGGTPFYPPGQPSFPLPGGGGGGGEEPAEEPEDPTDEPPPPGRPGGPAPSNPSETTKVYFVEGTTYTGFNTHTGFWSLAYTKPKLESIEKANTGADVVQPLVWGNQIQEVGIDPQKVTLSFETALGSYSITAHYASGNVTVTSSPPITVGLIFGRHQQYNSPIYGGELLWDSVFTASVTEVGTVDGNGDISFYPVAKPVYSWG